MSRTVVVFVGAIIAILSADRTLRAQVTIQQPVVQVFSVNTTVSVPDRGSAFIGGVKRAGDSRNTFGFGPFRPGSSVGTFREHAGLSTHVWIHEFDEMDRMLLGAAGTSRRSPRSVQLTGNARHAFDTLAARLPVRQVTDTRIANSIARPNGDRLSRASTRSAGNASRSMSLSRHAVRAERCYRLGLQAEQRGKTQLARLHFQVAAKHGSVQAKQILGQLPRVAADK